MKDEPDLINQYRARIQSGEIDPDPAQKLIIEKLNLLAHRVQTQPENKGGFARALFGWGKERVSMENAQGLYIYGSVGRGKSMIMDMFAGYVGALAWRVHFHEFMQNVHKLLDKARANGQKDPLDVVSEEIAKDYRVLCLDEMQVENIADAMIVGRLFEGLFERGTVLVTTSNRHPDDLYKNGLNRHRFTPFIDEISNACEVISLDGERDYRQHDEEKTRYVYPLDNASKAKFDAMWKAVVTREGRAEIDLGKRAWVFENASENAVLLSFKDACEAARGTRDYHALAKRFPHIFIDNIPKLDKGNTSAAARFVTLIDVLYEAETTLYLRLEDAPENLHDDENTRFVWDRTLSRLTEMGKV